MPSLPFGVARLDSILEGGAPPGNVVLLAGESGAGAREFLYTSAAMNALGHADAELFDLYYGDLPADAALPDEVHYLSFTADTGALTREMGYTMADEIVDAARSTGSSSGTSRRSISSSARSRATGTKTRRRRSRSWATAASTRTCSPRSATTCRHTPTTASSVSTP